MGRKQRKRGERDSKMWAREKESNGWKKVVLFRWKRRKGIFMCVSHSPPMFQTISHTIWGPFLPSFLDSPIPCFPTTSFNASFSIRSLLLPSALFPTTPTTFSLYFFPCLPVCLGFLFFHIKLDHNLPPMAFKKKNLF